MQWRNNHIIEYESFLTKKQTQRCFVFFHLVFTADGLLSAKLHVGLLSC